MKEFRAILLIVSLTVCTLSCSKGNNVSDINEEETVQWKGKTYHTVRIGNQIWMKENLDVGMMISVNQEQTDNGIIEKYYLNNDSLNYSHLGAIYQWDEAMLYSDIAGSQGICPPGWHIPTIKEFDSLRAKVNFDGRVLLAVGQGSGEGAGNNSSGFSALYSGYRDTNGKSYLAPPQFWTSSNTPGGVYIAGIENNSSLLYRSLIQGRYGYSIRCIKNNP